jgi:DNA-binding transcriptional ArsR family regulator
MAELALLPAVRAAGADTLIVAGGTSCRHQIGDGTRGAGARQALHPLLVLEQALAREGIGAALAGLDRDVRWHGTTLVLPHAGLWTDRQIHAPLAGRGLVLAPTVMTDRPVPYFPLDPAEPVVLLCPVASPAVAGVAAPQDRDVDRLVGRSRGAILRHLAAADTGRSTSEVGELAQLSTPTASEHLTVLRGAGLVRSTRHGKRMVHTVTPLGSRLLRD